MVQYRTTSYCVYVVLIEVILAVVLAGKKQPELEKKGKGAKDAQWEAEVRQSLANKKKAAGTPVLSKQDAALVDAQLKKEAIIRERVNAMKARLERGLQLIHSLVSAQVEELKKHLSTVVDLLLIGGFGKAVRLVGSTAFDRYLVRMQPMERVSLLKLCRISQALPQTGWIPSRNGLELHLFAL